MKLINGTMAGIHSISALLIMAFFLLAQGILPAVLATELTPQQQERIESALKTEQETEKKVKLLLLLVRNSQEKGALAEELTYRSELHRILQKESLSDKLKIANLHELGKLNFQRGELKRSRELFLELLEIIPVADIRSRNLTLQYLSKLSAALNDFEAEETHLAKYVIATGLTSEFYASSGGFDKLLELTERNQTLNQHYYYANWHEVARQNGTPDDQRRVLTQWVNYTTEHSEHFSEKPFAAYTEFLREQGQREDLREIQLLHAQSTPDESQKAAIYEEILRQNQAEMKDTDLGLLTFLVDYYDRNQQEQEKQELLKLLAKRPDYPHQANALKELAVISLKNQDLLLSFNTHEELFATIPEIRTPDDLVILDNLIGLSQQLSRDDSLEKYLTQKALNRSASITNQDRQQTFTLLFDHLLSSRKTPEALKFYQTFVNEKVIDPSYPGYYEIHLKAAVTAEKAADFKLALTLYNRSLDHAIEYSGYTTESIKIAQRILQLTETHRPGSAEFLILAKIRTIYEQLQDLEGVARTDLMIAQKHRKNNRTNEAIEAYQQALANYRTLDNQEQVSRILTLLANLEESDSGEKLARLIDLETSLEQTGRLEELISTRFEIGNYHKLHNELDTSRQYYLKAFNTEPERRTYLALQSGYYGTLILTRQGELQAANAILREIVQHQVSPEQQDVITLSLQALAKNSSSAGDQEEALALIDQALSLQVDTLKVSLLLTKSAILVSLGSFEQALAIARDLENRELSNSDWLTLYLHTAKANVGLQRYDAALLQVNKGIGLLSPGQVADIVFELYSLKSHILRSSGDLNNAISNQSQLITLLEAESVTEKLGLAHVQLSDLFVQAGQLSNALGSSQLATSHAADDKLLTIRISLNVAKINRMQNNLQQSMQRFETINKLMDNSVPPELQADIFYQEGFTYLQVARLESALQKFKQSEALFRQIGQQKEARQARLAQANVLMKQGSIQQSETIFQSVLNESDDDPALQADVFGSLAFLYTELGQYTKALENSEEAEKRYRNVNLSSRIPEVLNARGLIFLRMNDFGQSEILLLRALELNKDQDNPLLDSEITNNLGGLYKTKGDLKKARTQLIKTAELQKALGFESLLALTFNNIGSVYLEEGRYDEALDFLKQSRDFATRYDLKKELAVSWNNEGILFFRQQKYPEAQAAFDRALKPQKELNLKVDLARTLNNLAIIAAAAKNTKKALDLVQEAIAALSLSELDDGEFYPNPPQRSILASSLMKDFLQNKGAFLREIADTFEQPASRIKYLEASFLSFDLSIDLIEALRAQIKSEASQQLLLQTNIDIYQQMIAILYELGELTKNPDFHEKAFFYAEKSRARSFLDQLQEQAARASLSLPQEIQDKENNLKSQISLLDTNIFVELSKPESERDERKIEEWQLDKTEQQIQYTRLTQELEEKFPAYASLKYPTVYGVSEVKAKLLDEQTQILVYFLGKDVSYGWRVSAHRFEMISLPPAADIDQLIRKYRKTLADPLVFYDEEEELVIDATKTHLVSGLQLYRTFLQPLLGQTPDSIKKLLIIPDGVLYYLPFEAVLVQMHSQTDKTYTKGREYLINRYSIYYSPSTSVLGMIQEQAKQRDQAQLAKRKEFVGFGDPQYSPSDSQRSSFEYNPTLRGLGFYDMPRLLATKNELDKISAMFPGKATTYLRDDAVESTAKNRISGYKYVHFATHGIMDEENPEYSGVVLNLIVPDKPQDGFLQASEIFDLELDADLVVLSACETGLGKVIKGEGMVGLTRAFLYAGSPAIVVSLWTVADDSTSKLMIYFYRYLKEGYSKDEALRQAKLELMTEKNLGDFIYNDPFFWGPFILNGMNS